MFTLRRSTCSLSVQSYGKAGIARICFSQFSVPDHGTGKDASIQLVEHTFVSITTAAGSNNFSKPASSRGFSASSLFSGYRTLSTLSSATTDGNSSDLEDGFSELDEIDTKGDEMGAASSDESHANCDGTDIASDERDSKALPSETGDESASEDEDEVEADDLKLLGNEKDGENTLPENSSGMLLFNCITKALHYEVGEAISKYSEDGHSITCKDVTTAMCFLRKRKQFHRALQLSEWVESNKCYDLTDLDYAIHIDLIAKVHGLYSAEKKLSMIPESFHSEFVYRALLLNSVSSRNIKKAEEIFKKMRELGLPLTDYTCNQLLLLYSRIDKKKISDVLMMMEKENIKPSIFTYRILIDAKGHSNDISGMEQVVETMKADGMEVNKYVLATVARHYIFSGFKGKGEAILKEIEGDNLQNKDRWAVKFLLSLYASLGKEEDVERIWNYCKENPRMYEYQAAILAWGKLGMVNRAEEIFEQKYKTQRKLHLRCCNALLNIYAKHKLLAKGKELIKKMSNEGCYFDKFTWDGLVKLYVEAGEVEKADSLLHKLMEKSPQTPFFSTYMCLLSMYSARGDIHNAEKIFDDFRKCGMSESARALMYNSLLDAYINAKTPAYGFSERMAFDKIYMNNTLSIKLQTINSFKKSADCCFD